MKTVIFSTFLLFGLIRADGPKRGDTASARTLTSEDTCANGVVNCAQCLQKPDCVWCADRQGLEDTLVRCRSAFTRQECENVVNLIPRTTSDNQNQKYLSPTQIDVRLRRDKPVNFSITYTQKNFPVDLYILLDLSYSMKDDKEKLSKLGGKMALEMKDITEDFRLGFGSFVDKTVLPYAKGLTKNETAEGVRPPYGFIHHLSLTSSTDDFERKVNSTPISTNIDSPEGGLEALVQAMVCEKQIGWRNNSRKIIILATDAESHSAGDGKLGGIIIPNDGKCHISPIEGTTEYNYDWVNKQDYPSIGQVAYIASERRTSIIFAVSQDRIYSYNTLSSFIEGASAAMLTDDSSNIVDVVKEQYQKISGTVTLQEENLPEYISLKYYARCGNAADFVESKGCHNVTNGQVLQFNVEATLTKCEKLDRIDKFTISPIGIQEKVNIGVTSMCQCPCEKDREPNAPYCAGRGDYFCGICQCNTPYAGNTCECDTTNSTIDSRSCKKDSQALECDGRGECKCGKCECKSRYSGKFCECDNEGCQRSNNLLCSGENHGTCECGTCNCLPAWSGSKCECSTAVNNCKRPGSSQICSNNGFCLCNQCQCNENENGHFTGAYCENCPGCSDTECSKYEWPLYCSVFGEPPQKEANCSVFSKVEFEWIEDENDKTNEDELCRAMDKDSCTYTFLYRRGTNGTFRMVKSGGEERDCPKPADVAMIAGSVTAATLLIGLALILLWRLLTYLHDRREYAKFEEEKKRAQWANDSNPLYKGPTSEFKNPAYGK